MSRQKKHKTTHAADAHDGKVLVLCETCRWREHVEVDGLPWVEAIARIFAARDAHEAAPQ